MNNDSKNDQIPEQKTWLGKLLWFCLTNRLIVLLAVLFVIAAGLLVAPFDWRLGDLPRWPVAVDAIPDIGENQQVVFTEWPGRSPQDIEDQVTYPLTVSLLGVPGVKTIRSNSMFGFSSIYVIFKDDVEFYWSRSRILEKLNALPAGSLPTGVRPALGPDATALGQIFWYTLEGRDPDGQPVGGWDLEELRTLQDWYVRYNLAAAEGVSEIASVGGFVREYQVDVDPDAMRAFGVSLADVYAAIKASNIDVGAKTIEVNRVEYFIRGVGFIKEVHDIEQSVVKVVDNVPVLIKHIATVSQGPALRRGALDKGGAEAVGGVVVARYGENPLSVIKNIKQKIKELAPGLPEKVVLDNDKVTLDQVHQFAKQHGMDEFIEGKINHAEWLTLLRELPPGEWPGWITTSQVTLVPFYDRAGLIYETLGTLNRALTEEILVAIIVVIVMVVNLRSSILISGLLPLAVLMCFIAMKAFGVDANIVALSGIAIAIGTMVDMAIVICENILRHLDKSDPDTPCLKIIHRAVSEVAAAVLTAVLTTVISFLPVFTLTGAEGKLFKPLAFTKTFALVAAVIIALTVIPPAATVFFRRKKEKSSREQTKSSAKFRYVFNITAIIIVGILLTRHWEPLGAASGMIRNLIFVALLMAGLLGLFFIFQKIYPALLGWCLRHKKLFLSIPVIVVFLGIMVWIGFADIFAPLTGHNQRLQQTSIWQKADKLFPGLGKEFMPSLDEGSFLYMPTTMTHASIGEALDILSKQDRAFANIPEIDSVVGKIGRAETPLDPAPVSMIETVINYKSEYIVDPDGHRKLFKYDSESGSFVRDGNKELVPDKRGRPYRQWREHIRSPQDIWDEIVDAGQIPGTTSAPKLQPIETRLIMLQSGMRAPMGVKIKGPTLEAIEQVGLQIENHLKEVPGVNPATVNADRMIGKPYLEIVPDRAALARYGVAIRGFQDVVETGIGGRNVTWTVEGRERFAVRLRYQRELRDQLETLGKILIPGAGGVQIPLDQLAEIRYVRGPQSIKSEDTSLIGYVLFDKKPGYAEVDVVEACERYLIEKEDSEELIRPEGVNYKFTGTYENQVHSQKTLMIVLPVALLLIFLILYFQFKRVSTTFLVFSGIFVAWSGGFILLWLYAQPWFLNFDLFGTNMQQLFQVHPINLSVAVWVGFLALFGIASDDGVIICTYLNQVFRDKNPDSVQTIREATLLAGRRRIRPCLMTVATTVLALIPVLTSTGRGSDVMVPMAIPTVGGMTAVLYSILLVPTLYCTLAESRLKKQSRNTT